MAVPDWPNTYGYNMFLFPISKWVGGIFYEHTHRLVASGVGFLTLGLAGWVWLRDERAWMRKLGFVAVVAVIVQGVLGGLRVTLIKDEIGIFHGTLAQLFFSLVSLMALFTSSWWARARRTSEVKMLRRVRGRVMWATGAVLCQLVIGATMRHEHAGLAIPDFPLAYGRLYPETTPGAVERYNAGRMETVSLKPIRASHVHLQMAHRLMAVVVVGFILWVGVSIRRELAGEVAPRRLSQLWVGLVSVQFLLGAATIWTSKSADVATAHMAIGSLILMLGFQMILVLGRLEASGSVNVRAEGCA